MARKKNKRTVRQTFLIVVEGDTEFFYFAQLRPKCKISSVAIDVKQKDSKNSPERMLEYAKSFHFNKEFDQTWLVWDRDTTDRQCYENVRTKADKDNFYIADSNPCFELWFLLHFTFTTRSFKNCKQAEDALKHYLPDYCNGEKYSKNLFQRLLPRLPKALENCAKLKEHNQKNDIPDGSFSNVDKLMLQIETMDDMSWAQRDQETAGS